MSVGDGRRDLSSKFQAPSTREIPSTKLQDLKCVGGDFFKFQDWLIFPDLRLPVLKPSKAAPRDPSTLLGMTSRIERLELGASLELGMGFEAFPTGLSRMRACVNEKYAAFHEDEWRGERFRDD